MNHLFICSTPLQLIHVVNIKLNLFTKHEATLYILDHNKYHHDMYIKIMNTNIFNKVILIKSSKYNTISRFFSNGNRLFKYIWKSFEYLFYKIISKFFVKDTCEYDKFWVSCMDYSSWLIFMKYKNKNKKLELNFFEDGMGAYTQLTEKQGKMELKLLHLLGFKGIYEETKFLFIYKPEYCVESLYPHIKLKKIPEIESKYTKNVLNSLFPININSLNCQFLFFDQPILFKEIQNKQTNIIKTLTEQIGNNFGVLLHPRTKLIKSSINNLINMQVPFEIICLNKDVSNHVILSIYSTVGITPKFIFNQEPYVIFLYKIINVFDIEKTETFEFIENFAQCYSNPKKVFIPDTLEDLKTIINEIKKVNIQNDI